MRNTSNTCNRIQFYRVVFYQLRHCSPLIKTGQSQADSWLTSIFNLVFCGDQKTEYCITRLKDFTNMKIQIILLSLLVQALNAVEVHDESRSMLRSEIIQINWLQYIWFPECPEGYSYYGEVEVTAFPQGWMVQDGGRTPTYSCYQLHQGDFDWVKANQKSVYVTSFILTVNKSVLMKNL